MPPKRKTSSSSPPSIHVTSPKTPTTAELADRMLSKYTVTTKKDSSPLLAKSKQIEADIPAIGEETVEKNEVYSPTPDAADDCGTEEASAKQGTTKEKKPTALKRKATPTDETPEPGAKKRKDASTKRKTTPKKTAPATKRRSKNEEEQGPSSEPPPPPPLPPLSLVVKRKILAVNDFLDTHPKRLLEHDAGSHVASVDELDLLAALIILRVDYQLTYTVAADVSFEDADEMIVDRLQHGKVSVDFNKRCDFERAAQAVLAGRQTGLETVNFLEVEIDMLVAKRKQLVEDEMPAAGFRVYDDDDEVVDQGADDHEFVEEHAAEEDGVFEESTIEEKHIEEDVVERDVVEEEDTVEDGTIEKDILGEFVNEEVVHEREQEEFEEQGVLDESEEESEEE